MSTLRVNNITDNSGGTNNLNVPGTAKAWVNFNGTGTVAIRASFNVSSITDNGTGDYTVNFTNAMTDADYSAQQSAGSPPTAAVRQAFGYWLSAPTTTAYRILTTTFAGADIDPTHVAVAIFR